MIFHFFDKICLTTRPMMMASVEVRLVRSLLFRADVVYQRDALVFCPAHGGQDDFAASGGHARRMEHLHGLLPRRAFARLRLHPLRQHEAVQAVAVDPPRPSLIDAVYFFTA